MSDESLHKRCQRVVAGVLKKNRWTLVPADDESFNQAILDRIVERYSSRLNESTEISDDVIERAVKNAYCVRLYGAYKQEGSEEQIVAMTEVKQFVYRCLLILTEGDEMLADICAQDAVSRAWQEWHTVRDPGTFLGFVLRIGVHEKLGRDRKDKKLEALDEQEDDPSALALFGSQKSPDEETEISDFYQRLQTVIEYCLSRIEADLIIALILKGKRYKELSQATGIRETRLQMKKFRALTKLKKCKEFIDLWRHRRGSE